MEQATNTLNLHCAIAITEHQYRQFNDGNDPYFTK